MQTKPLYEAPETPLSPEKTEPLITPPLEPEPTPIVVRDHGVDSDEEHDIDESAGDEGIDDEEDDGVDEK